MLCICYFWHIQIIALARNYSGLLAACGEDSSEAEVQQELQQSQLTLEKNLGIVIQQFCYPYGDPFNRGNWFQRQRIMTLLAADGYVDATTAFGMTGSMQDSFYPLALLRIPVYGFESFQGFVVSLPWE